MEESLQDAAEEIKRAEHLFYVSLKYTRTVDVIRSLLERLISTFDHGMLSLLKYAKEKKKISEIPSTPSSRCELLGNTFKDLEIQSYLDMYILFRKLIRFPYTKREEYRRHVTMISKLENRSFEVNIDILEEYYNKTMDFLRLVAGVVKPKK
ncbi:MAG: hypothetical protein KKC75_01365 [Nanoarchaeota archaeon]|nr:hypothetical protein [Nanoarchaeota archaeon]MBU1004398.1 hypothetical protein [Nanoarchaeota archaeon]MBU1946715.1 hypothetical protein [Nanoarchaeota archaeon]